MAPGMGLDGALCAFTLSPKKASPLCYWTVDEREKFTETVWLYGLRSQMNRLNGQETVSGEKCSFQTAEHSRSGCRRGLFPSDGLTIKE